MSSYIFATVQAYEVGQKTTASPCTVLRREFESIVFLHDDGDPMFQQRDRVTTKDICWLKCACMVVLHQHILDDPVIVGCLIGTQASV